LLLVTLPVVAVIALCSLWLGPWAKHKSQDLITAANHNLLITGLEPGRFTELPGGGGVVYVGSMSNDGTRLSRIFVYKQDGDRLDVTTAKNGALSFDGPDQRYLTLNEGFRVEGPLAHGRDFRLMRYASNDLRLPQDENKREGARDWQLTRVRGRAGMARVPDIEGYCSRQSVAAGETLDLFVSTTPAARFKIVCRPPSMASTVAQPASRERSRRRGNAMTHRSPRS
jgi:hypothetical protein